MRQIWLARPGDTPESERGVLLGKGDPSLAPAGERRMRALRKWLRILELPPEAVVVAAPQRRAWRSAELLVGPDRRVVLEADLRGVDYGRWEGRRPEEVAAADPARFEDWKKRAEPLAIPGGEAVADLRARIARAAERLLARPEPEAIVVADPEILSELVRALVGEPLPEGRPEPGELGVVTREADGPWFRGRRSSLPEPLRRPFDREGLSGVLEAAPPADAGARRAA